MEHLAPRRALDTAYVSEIVGEPIKGFSVAEGSKKGDNVIGKMLALNVETEEGAVLDVVVKSLLPLVGEVDAASLAKSQFFIDLQLFPTEITYYQKVRPILEQVSGYAMSRPRIFSCNNTGGKDDHIALEDLRPEGYKMADKRKGLTLQEVTKVLDKLAILHAHSYNALSQDNPAMQELQNTSLSGHVWSRTVADLNQDVLFNTLIEKMAEVMRETGEAETSSKMDKFAKNGFKILMELSEKTGTSPKYFRVVIHGDLWTNNILFKYAPDAQTVNDVVFIDFQQCRFGNIYEDLLYFIFTSTTAEFRKAHLRTCLQSYFNAFQDILEHLDNPSPLPRGFTDEELIATFYENIEYGFCYDLVAIPFQLSEEGQGPPQDQGPPPPQDQQPSQPTPLEIILMMVEGMKLGTKNSPIAIQRLKELCAEMAKLNIL